MSNLFNLLNRHYLGEQIEKDSIVNELSKTHSKEWCILLEDAIKEFKEKNKDNKKMIK